MQNGKAPDPYGYPIEIFKKNSDKLVPILLDMFNDYLSNGSIPQKKLKHLLSACWSHVKDCTVWFIPSHLTSTLWYKNLGQSSCSTLRNAQCNFCWPNWFYPRLSLIYKCPLAPKCYPLTCVPRGAWGGDRIGCRESIWQGGMGLFICLFKEIWIWP